MNYATDLEGYFANGKTLGSCRILYITIVKPTLHHEDGEKGRGEDAAGAGAEDEATTAGRDRE